MTNSFPILTLITVISTNWIRIPSDLKREGGTNYAHERLVVRTNVYIEEVSLCTNRTPYKAPALSTNGSLRWEPLSPLTPPPLPGQAMKE